MTFNYRVGILGHLHSRKLADEATLQMDVPPCFRSTANLGLIDSHMAFDWVGQVQNPSIFRCKSDSYRGLLFVNSFHQVKKHIHHFGGDKDNITGIGESAGAGMQISHKYESLILD